MVCWHMFSRLFHKSASRLYKTSDFLLQTKHLYINPFHRSKPQYRSIHSSAGLYSKEMDLKCVIKELEGIAPTSMAEDWDNVGLLLEPSESKPIKHIFLTNDLTEPVLAEALQLKDKGHENVGLIISYHPPIFRPFKRLTQSTAKERIIVKAIESKIAIYSPHTAYDVVWGGVNDWLATGINDIASIKPLSVKQVPDGNGYTIEVGGIKDMVDCNKVAKFLQKDNNKCTMHTEVIPDAGTPNGIARYRLKCTGWHDLTEFIPSKMDYLSEYTVTVSPSNLALSSGAGRLLTLSQPVPISELIRQVKDQCDIPNLRLALPSGMDDSVMVTTVAICVGSGGSMLKSVKADVLLTGEMSHHDVLEAVSRGAVCILCEHSNTERGYLRILRDKLESQLAGVEISLSKVDKDPITIV